MRDLLATHGFDVTADSDGLQRARACALTPGVFEYTWIRWHHVVEAEAR
jgi:hypothetical protein